MTTGASTEPAGDGFSPTAETLRADSYEAVCGLLRQLLGLPEGAPLRWDGTRPPVARGIGELLVTLEPEAAASLKLDVRAADKTRRAWISGPGFQLSYRRGADGLDPFEGERWRPQLVAIERHARRLANAPEADMLARRLGKAVERSWNALDVSDWMYRQVSWAGSEHYGTLRLGFRCNQDCGFCWQGRDWPGPAEAMYEIWLDELAAKGIRQLTITGGEPTLHKTLPELVKRAVQVHRMRVEIQTNAVQLRKRALAETLAAAGVGHLFVSFHAADPVVSDGLTRAPGTHQHTVAGIETALDVGLRVMLNCVVEQANHRDLVAHATMIRDRFVKPFPANPVRRVSYSHPCEYYDAGLWKDAVVPIDEVQPHLFEAVGILRDAGVIVDVIGTCGFPPCLFRDDPTLIGWMSRTRYDTMDVAGRFYPEPCQRCAAKDRCLGVRREYYDLFGTRGIAPFETLPY